MSGKRDTTALKSFHLTAHRSTHLSAGGFSRVGTRAREIRELPGASERAREIISGARITIEHREPLRGICAKRAVVYTLYRGRERGIGDPGLGWRWGIIARLRSLREEDSVGRLHDSR